MNKKYAILVSITFNTAAPGQHLKGIGPESSSIFEGDFLFLINYKSFLEGFDGFPWVLLIPFSLIPGFFWFYLPIPPKFLSDFFGVNGRVF